MKTTALRLYGENDLRLESFELPEIKEGEILAKIVSDSLCMSSYKATIQGSKHKRVPDDVADNPIIIGHEFCGELVKIGSKWENQYKVGSKFVVQPSMNYQGRLDAPGYSFPYYGGDCTYIIIPEVAIMLGCLIPYEGDSFFYGSLAEPTLKKGDVIKKGATIGTMSTSATSEMADGAHVHFAVYLNGNVVSPYDYLPVGDK